MKTIKDLQEGSAIRYVLEAMFKKVSAEEDKVDLAKEGWFHTYTWTAIQEKEFKNWLVKELSKKRWLWEGLTDNKPYTMAKKANRVKLAEEFLFMWGWKTYQKEDEA